MPDYREFVEKIAAGHHPSEVILNRSHDHASVVIETLFKTAKKHVHFLVQNLNPEVYGRDTIISAASNFLRLDPHARIEVVTETTVDRNTHPFLIALSKIDPTRIVLRLVAPDLVSTYKFNFAVTDTNGYRFEESRDTPEAVVQFGEPEFSKRLEGTFSSLFRKSVPI